jgi:hypothetical protein
VSDARSWNGSGIGTGSGSGMHLISWIGVLLISNSHIGRSSPRMLSDNDANWDGSGGRSIDHTSRFPMVETCQRDGP